MAEIRQYLISVTAAAILCGIVNSFLGKKGALSVIGKLLTGLFLSLTVVSPWAHLQLGNLADYASGISSDATIIVQTGEIAAQEALAARIKDQTEAYILDKAAAWGMELTVDVTVSNSTPPVPCTVRISGAVSPYNKTRLSQMLEDEIGIAKEDQTWTM